MTSADMFGLALDAVAAFLEVQEGQNNKKLGEYVQKIYEEGESGIGKWVDSLKLCEWICCSDLCSVLEAKIGKYDRIM